MRKLVVIIAFTALAIGGCSTGVGPSHAEFADALGVSQSDIKKLRCHGFAEEPTEFDCHYRLRSKDGDWQDQEVPVAIDGSGWVLIDTPGPPYQPG
jgi:hypothetical protein